TSHLSSIGLDGKMGVCVFFYELYEATKSEEHLIFADRLLDEIFSDVGTRTDVPFGASNGICGIGIGLSSLCKRGFIEDEGQTVFSALDNTILSDSVFTKVGNLDYLSKELYYYSRF